MTTNVYSNTPAGTGRDIDDNQSSSEIRSEIDQTRASVGEKIDQLQARLDPNRLKQQAQETVQEMITDTANSMTEYVRTHKDEMVSSLTDAARRNPLPTALVGLGVGWLLLESLGGGRRSDDRSEYERRYNRPNRFEGSTGRNFVSQGRGQFMEEDYYTPEYYDAPDYGRSGYPAQGSSTMYGSQGGYSGQSGYTGQSAEVQGSGYQDNQKYGNGHHRNPLAKAADAVKDTVSNVGEEIKDRVEGAGQEIKERMSDMKENISGTVSSTVGDMRQQGMQMRDRTGGQMQHSMHRANERMHEWERRARWESQRRGRQVMRNLEDNPLTYGALALAAGAALALLLPQTRTENRYFGEMRDQIMDKGQDAMETAKMHAQEVVAEVRPELEQKARQIVSDATELGKEVVKDAADELKPVMDKAISKGKEEARTAAQEVGVNPDKLTGSKPALNRDTLAGQWKQVRGDIKSKWGQLTDDELTRIEGDYEKLAGAIQTRYGYTRARAEQEINDFFSSRKA